MRLSCALHVQVGPYFDTKLSLTIVCFMKPILDVPFERVCVLTNVNEMPVFHPYETLAIAATMSYTPKGYFTHSPVSTR